ncbi:MAG: NAD(P)-binding domain-containing protein [Pseudonocardiaceae bacterium]
MTRDRMFPRTQPVTVGVIGAGRVGRAVTAAVVTDGLADAVLVHSRRSVEATALSADAADLAAAQHTPTRVDAVKHVRELRACSVIVVCVRARFTNGRHRPHPARSRRRGPVRAAQARRACRGP